MIFTGNRIRTTRVDTPRTSRSSLPVMIVWRGSGVAGRRLRESEEVIGMVVNTIPIPENIAPATK